MPLWKSRLLPNAEFLPAYHHFQPSNANIPSQKAAIQFIVVPDLIQGRAFL
jgi:hypothetical protein